LRTEHIHASGVKVTTEREVLMIRVDTRLIEMDSELLGVSSLPRVRYP